MTPGPWDLPPFWFIFTAVTTATFVVVIILGIFRLIDEVDARFPRKP